jgi:hypothetical protein
MIDLAQADSTLRTNNNNQKHYYVEDSNGFIYGSFDSHSHAIRFALKDIDNRKVITKTN